MAYEFNNVHCGSRSGEFSLIQGSLRVEDNFSHGPHQKAQITKTLGWGFSFRNEYNYHQSLKDKMLLWN